MENKLRSIIAIYVTRFLLPFIFAFGIYVQINSFDSPGGGFQAGVLMASALILHSIVFGHQSTLKVVPFNFLITFACFGMSIYLIAGMISSLAGKTFLDYGMLSDNGVEGQKLGIFSIELGVGFAVFSTICIIFYSFVGEETRKTR